MAWSQHSASLATSVLLALAGCVGDVDRDLSTGGGNVMTGPDADGGTTVPDASRPAPKDAGSQAEPERDAGEPATDTEDAGTPDDSDDIPAGAHCASVASFSAQASQFEQDVLKLTNDARAKGHNCDSKGNFGPTSPLKMAPELRCSARLHSKYMAQSGDFAHTQSSTGLDPFDRMMAAGYSFLAAGENIAAGQRTPKEVVDGWLESDGHCSNIMSPSFTEIGIGYVVASGSGPLGPSAPYWTQNFAKPR